jgi:hypothetical protein
VPAVSAAPRPSSEIRRVIRAHAPHFSGTILVARNGRTLFHESFGLASRQLDVPNANGTVASADDSRLARKVVNAVRRIFVRMHTPFHLTPFRQ